MVTGFTMLEVLALGVNIIIWWSPKLEASQNTSFKVEKKCR